jgi:hypothetical protein
VCGVVAAIAARRARWLGQEPHLLVVTYGLQIAARPPSQFRPLQALHSSLIAHRKSSS